LEESYKDGHKDGLFTLYEDGQKHREGSYLDRKKNGLFTEWYNNGQKKQEGSFKEGRLSGRWAYWNEEGHKYSEETFKDGKKDGLFIEYHPNGQKSTEESWKEDKKDGLFTEWYENGQKKQEGELGNFNYKLGKWSYWKEDGNKYLDMMSAYSAVSHGHSHPELIKVLHRQSEVLGITSRAFYTDILGAFLEKLVNISGLDIALPMNTGAEAVETAIKAARRWAYKTKKVEANKAEIIVAEGNFHGRTTTIISFSTDEQSKEDFGPYTPGFVSIKYGCTESLKEAITKK